MSVFGVRADERTCVFIDGPNLYTTCKSLNFDVDFKKLRDHFEGNTRLVRLNYFTPVHEHDDDHVGIRPLLDWLDYNGFNVVSKPIKEFVDSMGRRKLKGSMDIEMVVSMMEIAPKVDHILLFSGDGDFRSAVEAVQRLGARVTVVSSVAHNPPMVADDLRRQADRFVDLMTAAPVIARNYEEANAPLRPRTVRAPV